MKPTQAIERLLFGTKPMTAFARMQRLGNNSSRPVAGFAILVLCAQPASGAISSPTDIHLGTLEISACRAYRPAGGFRAVARFRASGSPYIAQLAYATVSLKRRMPANAAGPYSKLLLLIISLCHAWLLQFAVARRASTRVLSSGPTSDALLIA
jgi:hypothetical protein